MQDKSRAAEARRRLRLPLEGPSLAPPQTLDTCGKCTGNQLLKRINSAREGRCQAGNCGKGDGGLGEV